MLYDHNVSKVIMLMSK